MDGRGVDWVGRSDAIGGATRSEDAFRVSEDGDAPWLVEGEPVFDAVAEAFEADLRRSHEWLFAKLTSLKLSRDIPWRSEQSPG